MLRTRTLYMNIAGRHFRIVCVTPTHADVHVYVHVYIYRQFTYILCVVHENVQEVVDLRKTLGT